MKPWPYGVINLLSQDPDQHGVPLNLDDYSAAFTNTNVRGHRYRGIWSDVEPTNGTFKWTTEDALVARAHDNGQFVGLSWSAGCFSPQWFATAHPEAIYHTHYNACDMPLPWNTDFQAAYFALIHAAGARYENNPAVAYVNIAGWMQHFDAVLGDLTDETQLDALAKQAGYSDIHAAVQSVGKKFVDEWCRTWPTTTMLYMTDRVFPDTAGQTDYKAVQTYGIATYHNFGIMPGNGLKAQASPYPTQAPVLAPGLEQFFGIVTGLPCASTYISPIPSPCPADPKALDDTFIKAARDGSCGAETYYRDITPEGNQATLAAANVRFKANVPPGH